MLISSFFALASIVITAFGSSNPQSPVNESQIQLANEQAKHVLLPRGHTSKKRRGHRHRRRYTLSTTSSSSSSSSSTSSSTSSTSTSTTSYRKRKAPKTLNKSLKLYNDDRYTSISSTSSTSSTSTSEDRYSSRRHSRRRDSRRHRNRRHSRDRRHNTSCCGCSSRSQSCTSQYTRSTQCDSTRTSGTSGYCKNAPRASTTVVSRQKSITRTPIGTTLV